MWADLARALYYRAADLQQQSRVLQQSWTGPAADLYFLMVASLIEGLIAIADMARLVAECLYQSLESETYVEAAESLPQAPEVADPPPPENAHEYKPQPARLFDGLYRNGLATAQAALGSKFTVPSAVPPPVPKAPASFPPTRMPPMMMPPMMMPPMGMGMAGDNGSGRPVPEWLTEPEPEIIFGVALSNVDPTIE